jgi:hypothetical protein
MPGEIVPASQNIVEPVGQEQAKKLTKLVLEFERAGACEGASYSLALCLFPALIGSGEKRKIHL